MATWIESSIIETVKFLIKECSSEKPFEGFCGIPARTGDGIYYKGTNIPLLMMTMEKLGERTAQPLFSGFQSWKNLGYQVKKGGKASFTILAKGYLRINLETGESEKVTGIEEYDPKKYFIKPLLHSIKTFHFSQTNPIEGMDQVLPEPFHTNRLDDNGYEMQRIRQQSYDASQQVIERWHQKYSEAVPMSEAERSFIAKFGADLAIAHFTGAFRSEKYAKNIVDWLTLTANTNASRIMRSLSLAYQALVIIAPEISKKEAILQEMQEASKLMRQQEHPFPLKEEKVVTRVSLNF